MGLPLWAWDLFIVGLGFAYRGSVAHHDFFFFFYFFYAEFCLVMIFHKPHSSGVGFDVG